jgi:glutamate--cysteine ligase
MTVLHSVTDDALDQAEPLTIDGAYARSHQAALAESALGLVGLEIETHLVDLDSVAEPVPWDRVGPMLGIVAAAAGRSAVSLEPGGQLELSGPPATGIVTTVSELRADTERTRQVLGGLRLGVAQAGADPLRPPRRVNPRPRYRAMERHFTAAGRAVPGAVMMNSTAAMQVNL